MSAPSLTRVVKSLLRPAAERLAQQLDPRERIHYLHIGKNAGSQVNLVAAQINRHSDHYRIVPRGHDVRLEDLPPGERYFFSIRDPASRFVSGFYSRKRKGQPRIYSEWSKHEAAAFRHFDHANDLAEALFEPGERGAAAFSAIKSILHTAMDQVGWFERSGSFLELTPPIWILRQEHFSADLDSLMRALGCEKLQVTLANGAVSAHRNDYSGIPPLSPVARRNLARWYAQDYELYARCCAWLETQTVP